jgi:hypothetical protein
MLKWTLSLRELSFRFAAIILGLGILGSLQLRAQTYTVLYNFTGGRDGAFLDAPLTLDNAGNIYGLDISTCELAIARQ